MASVTIQGIVLTLTVVTTLFGNVLVLYLLYKPQRCLLKRPLYILIFNICVADIAVVFSSMGVKAIDEFYQDWFYGEAMCRIIEYSQRALFRVNIITHVFIAADRYYSVVFPLQPQTTRRRVKRIVVAIWLFSFVMSMPFLFSFDVLRKNGIRICMIVHLQWMWMEKIHVSIDLFMFFLLPLGILVWLYARIISSLMRHKRQSGDIGSMHATLTTIRAAIRGVRVSIIVITAFTICWIPVIVKGFNRLVNDNNVNTDRTDPLYETAMFFAFLNDAIVPLLYCALDTNLQPAANKLLRWFPKIQPEESSDLDGTANE